LVGPGIGLGVKLDMEIGGAGGATRRVVAVVDVDPVFAAAPVFDPVGGEAVALGQSAF